VKWRLKLLFVALVPLASQAAFAETTCYGDGAYRVCTTVTTLPDGSMRIESRDSMGNSYSVQSDVYVSPRGNTTIRSFDSMGNSYRVDSWSDNRGVHSRDSLGNDCAITNSGQVIGCQ
jgi:hypothetical protein